ncbi:MAG: cytochrome b, partial [Pseudomonadota bacterium]
TAFYFGFFLIILPLLGIIEKPRRLPNSISEAVLSKTSKVVSGGASAQPVGAAAAPEKKA